MIRHSIPLPFNHLEIVDLPILHMVIFHSFLYVKTRPGNPSMCCFHQFPRWSGQPRGRRDHQRSVLRRALGVSLRCWAGGGIGAAGTWGSCVFHQEICDRSWSLISKNTRFWQWFKTQDPLINMLGILCSDFGRNLCLWTWSLLKINSWQWWQW